MNWLDQINRHKAGLQSLPRIRKRIAVGTLIILSLASLLLYFQSVSRPPTVLLNIAFDAARPALTQLDLAWRVTSAKQVSSIYAGSIYQTEALANGLIADTVCLSSPGELDRLSQLAVGLVDPNWRSHFPAKSSPFSSSIVFIVRPSARGAIKDWPDLLKPNWRIAVPDPRISGAGQYAYLGLIYATERKVGADPLKIAAALRSIYFIPHAAPQSTSVFLRDTEFDALLTWESEALRLIQAQQNSEFTLVYPSQSIKIEVVVAIAASQVERRGTRDAAEDYLNFFFSPKGQGIIEQASFRPRTPQSTSLPPHGENILHSVETLFGSWEKAQELHLGANGSFTRLLEYRKARSGGTE